MNNKAPVLKISEKQINNLTKHHIARILSFLEGDEITEETKNCIKREFWFFNQNLKQKLWNNNIIYLNEKVHPWKPNTSKTDKYLESKINE